MEAKIVQRHILLYDNCNSEVQLVTEVSEKLNCKLTALNNKHIYLRSLQKFDYDLLIIDYNIADTYLDSFINQLSEISPLTPIVLMAVPVRAWQETKYTELPVDFVLFRPFGFRALQGLVKKGLLLSQRIREAAANTQSPL